MHGLVFSPEYQASHKLLNSAIYVLPEIAPDDPIEAVKRLLTFRSSNLLTDLYSLLGGASLLVKASGLKVLRSRFFPRFLQRWVIDLLLTVNPGFVVRELRSKGLPHKLESLGIHVITEQAPNPESRVVLSDQLDSLGSRRALAKWKISDADRRSVVHIGQLLRQELPKAGWPAPIMDDWITNDRPGDGPLVDMAHIIGTTRMSKDPRTGVVDERCEVHGVSGLYIAGSSVFPTSGHANPTLMLVSLAIRLADHLKGVLAQQGGTSVSDASRSPSPRAEGRVTLP
jgi:choline dehydrogenase-like flavoprotein